jgi:hypothetical protein
VVITSEDTNQLLFEDIPATVAVSLTAGDIKHHRHVVVVQWDHQVGTDFPHRRLLLTNAGTVTI